ncbi:transposon Tf2-1 polyprotein isoform X1 [Cucumis melo var. makuwa]|uniref:Transposon Tf2-1 polyprotein isoform X1 n=1 Tax=Cucumis melo var. makuwa TaxID=1194695 RepID=A0A5D3DZI1_CUCMM|nr:transposon Tf2-1 polyprotein isoform X1 [Cucumis melo var. makuwa]
MVQTRTKERMELIEQEIAKMKKEMSKIPMIELSLIKITKNLELMRLQSEKQQQAILMFMETTAKERSMMCARLSESMMRELSTTNMKENKPSSSCEIGSEKVKKKADIEDNNGDRNKFKKVEMPFFNGEDPNLWLFRVERVIELKEVSTVELNENEDLSAVGESLSAVLENFTNVFEWLEKLPPKRSIEHHTHLKKDINPINMRPYRQIPHTVIEELFDELNGASLFSKIDLKEVHQYGSIAAPLTQLLKKGGFKWSNEVEKAFEKLKKAMMTLPVLPLPDFSLLFETETDALGYGIGATKFVIRTDQRSLKFLLEQRVVQPQYQRWLAKLLGYSFEVVYKPGLESKVANAFSRMPSATKLYNLTAPTIVDLESIKEEVKKDHKLQKIIAEMSGSRDATEGKGLPKAHGFEVIFVVVDHLSKYGEKPKEWVKWLSWAEYWYNTAYRRALGIAPFQVVYGQKPPPLVYYGQRNIEFDTIT